MTAKLLFQIALQLFLLLNLLCLQLVTAQSYECFQFPEQKPSGSINLYSDVFNTKTTYLNAWQFLQERANITVGVESTCKPIYLFYIGRHSIRYPMKKEVVKFTEVLPGVRQELLRGGRLSRNVQADLQRWRLFISPSESARVTLSGQLDTALQARHFYQHFPNLLNIEKSNIEVGVTSKIRSKETAQAFIRAISELQMREKLPFEEANEAVEKLVKEKFAMPTKDNTIMSHERCKKHRTPERKARERKEYTELSQSAPIQIMVRQWYQRNGLQFPPSQSGKKSANSTAFDTMTTVYQACANEMAVLQHSPWCALFTTNELKALSYMSDTYEYRSSTNADNGIACTIMKDLTAQLDAATARLKGGRGPVTPGSTLYFSHKGMISRLVQHLGLFSRAPSHHLDPSNPGRLCVAGDRQFRSSTVLPFGANFAAVLHQCGGDKSGQLKLLTLYNEMPVKIAGCSSSFCDLNEFMQFYGSATCPVDVICPLKK